MKTKTLWKVHSILGLIAGLPLLVIAISGSILVFKDDLNRFLIPEHVLVDPPADPTERPLEFRLGVLQRELPQYEVTGWAFYDDVDRADFVYVVRHGTHDWLHVYQNPYTGEILSEPAATESEIMGWLLMLHYTFLAGHPGMAICGILAILLCFLGCTGFLIYRKFWKSFFTFRWRASLRLLCGNLHRRLGVVSAPVFLILGLTGAWWNIAHVIEEFGNHSDGEEHEPAMKRRLYATGLPLDRLVEAAHAIISDYQVNYISFPWMEALPVTFYGSFEEQNPFRSPYHSTVSFDAHDGSLLGHTRIDQASLWHQIYDAFEPLHFGTFGGLASRIVWCVLGLTPGLLAVSGFIIWIKRK